MDDGCDFWVVGSEGDWAAGKDGDFGDFGGGEEVMQGACAHEAGSASEDEMHG